MSHAYVNVFQLFHRKLFGGMCVAAAGVVFILLVIYVAIYDKQNLAGWTQFNIFVALFFVVLMEGLRTLIDADALKVQSTTSCVIIGKNLMNHQNCRYDVFPALCHETSLNVFLTFFSRHRTIFLLCPQHSLDCHVLWSFLHVLVCFPKCLAFHIIFGRYPGKNNFYFPGNWKPPPKQWQDTGTDW